MNLISSSIPPFLNLLAPNGRLIAYDHGEKRIGVATSDNLRIVATPHDTLETLPANHLPQKLQKLHQEISPSGIVIGLPLHMNGQESSQAKKVRTFSEILANLFTSTPLLLFDERLTTATVERMLVHEADLSRQKRKHHRDKLAACVLLQTVLDALRHTPV
jgi:putative Holliday junction resolvase